MVVLRILGSIELTDDGGRAVESVLRQQKRLAILAYLALTPHGRFVRRDSLLAIFWPTLDQEHARAALRKVLFHLRRELGEEAIVGRGDDEVRLDADVVACDAVAFGQAVDAGEMAGALELYGGELLPGLHVTEAAPEFAQWLDAQRARLRALATHAAWRRAASLEDAGDLSGAREWARTAASHDPLDEISIRRLMVTLERLGDRAGSIQAYEAFASRLRLELELEPSDATRALASDVRSREARPRALEMRGTQIESPPHRDTVGTTMVPVTAGASSLAPAVARPIVRGAHRRLLLVASVVVAVAAAVLALTSRLDSGAPATRGAEPPTDLAPRFSVAVLPFKPIGGDTTTRFLAEGLVEDLISALGRVPLLRVTARTSSSHFEDSALPVQEVARQLRVRHLLEGSVQRAQNRWRIIVRLVDAATGQELWDQTFEPASGEVFEVQTSVARSVAQALNTGSAQRSLSQTPRRTTNPAALEHYYAARGMPVSTQERVSVAIQSLEQAIRAEPAFAEAHAFLATRYANAPLYGAMTWADARPRALAAASRALALDSSLAEPHIARGIMYFLVDWDWARAELAFQRALQLDPNAVQALLFYCQLLAAVQRKAEAEVVMNQMFELDPISGGSNVTRALVLHHLGRYDEAIQQYRQTLRIDSLHANAWQFSLRPLLAAKRWPELTTALHHVAARAGTADSGEVWALVAALRDSSQRQLGAQVLRRWSGQEGRRAPFLGGNVRARFFAQLGLRDEAISLLETSYERREPALYNIAVEPLFAPLYADPRFRRIVNRMGLTLP